MQSPELAFLAEDAGTWSAEMVVNGPNGPQRSTGRSVSRMLGGRWDEATRTMTYRGEATMNGKPFRWRETTERMDADTRVFRTFMPTPDGGEFEVVTATYRRIG